MRESESRRKEYNRRYYLANRDRLIEYQRRYWREHHEERLAYERMRDTRDKVKRRASARVFGAAYRVRHRLEERERQRAFYAQHKEQVQEKHAAFYERNKARFVERAAEWRRANAKRWSFLTNGRHGPRGHTYEQWQELLRAHDFACVYCGRIDVPLTEDHIVPISRGGGDDIQNIVPACRRCNSRKGTKPADSMRARGGEANVQVG